MRPPRRGHLRLWTNKRSAVTASTRLRSPQSNRATDCTSMHSKTLRDIARICASGNSPYSVHKSAPAGYVPTRLLDSGAWSNYRCLTHLRHCAEVCASSNESNCWGCEEVARSGISKAMKVRRTSPATAMRVRGSAPFLSSSQPSIPTLSGQYVPRLLRIL